MSSKNVIGRLAFFFLFVSGLCIFAGNAGAQDEPVKQNEPETIVYNMKNCIDYTRSGSTFIFKSSAEFEAAIWTKGEYCPKKVDDIDFKKYTLLGVDIHNAECWNFPLKYKLTKDATAKLYRFQVSHPPVQAACAGLYHHGLWVLTPKLPEGYNVVFDVSEDANILKTREIDLKGCVQMFQKDKTVIRDKEDFLKVIRNDASRDRCLKDLEKAIDFSRNTLLGVNIDSGYCRIPAGLEYKTVKDDAKKLYTLQVSYIDPQGSVCRHMSSYDLWVLVPKMPAGYGAAFEVKAVKGGEDQ